MRRGLLALLSLGAMLLGSAQADGDDPFVVESASSNLREHVYFLSAVFAINLPEYITRAVDQGFELPLVMEVEVFEDNSFWFDSKALYIRQSYRINHHSLLDSVSVFNVNSGRRQLFPSLGEAINYLTVVLEQPLVDRNNLQADETYMARLRLGIDYGALPLPLKSTSFWANDWTLISDWYEWEMQP
jgi:hypothetical protein